MFRSLIFITLASACISLQALSFYNATGSDVTITGNYYIYSGKTETCLDILLNTVTVAPRRGCLIANCVEEATRAATKEASAWYGYCLFRIIQQGFWGPLTMHLAVCFDDHFKFRYLASDPRTVDGLVLQNTPIIPRATDGTLSTDGDFPYSWQHRLGGRLRFHYCTCPVIPISNEATQYLEIVPVREEIIPCLTTTAFKVVRREQSAAETLVITVGAEKTHKD